MDINHLYRQVQDRANGPFFFFLPISNKLITVTAGQVRITICRVAGSSAHSISHRFQDLQIIFFFWYWCRLIRRNWTAEERRDLIKKVVGASVSTSFTETRFYMAGNMKSDEACFEYTWKHFFLMAFIRWSSFCEYESNRSSFLTLHRQRSSGNARSSKKSFCCIQNRIRKSSAKMAEFHCMKNRY